tara:strand:- start:55 stop:651 length:597 start_codon:yes stop_codon:yes gene_type:complete
MEYAVLIVIGLVVFYLIGNSGKSTQTKQSTSLKDYVQPKTKYSLIEAREIVESFANEYGFNEIDIISERFQGLLYECRNEYKKEIKNIEKQIASTEAYWDKTISKIEEEILKKNFDSEEEKQDAREEANEEIKEIQNDCKDEVKVFEKQIKWYVKESEKLLDDCSTLLKKYISYLKSNESIPSLDELDLPKELPDSYY